MAVTITTSHVGKQIQQISSDPTHLLSSGNGTSTTVTVGRDHSPAHFPLKVTGSSNTDCITAYETWMGIIHDGKTHTL